jgi:hypothetical protein
MPLLSSNFLKKRGKLKRFSEVSETSVLVILESEILIKRKDEKKAKRFNLVFLTPFMLPVAFL